MKLAEALQARADLNRRIAQLNSRLQNNALTQEGEAPAEDPAELLQQLDDCLAQLEDLMARINLTNCQTTTPDGTLTQLLARRDCLHLRLQCWRALADAASQTAHRATHSEIKVHSTVEVRALQKQIDAAAARLRQTDAAIQAANWTTELL